MRLKAFSLIELLIVMAIIGLVSGLGIYGFLTFRRAIQLTQAVNEVVSLAKETRSLAKNNVLPKSITTAAGSGSNTLIYAYSLDFSQQDNGVDIVVRTLCSKSTTAQEAIWTCDAANSEQVKSQSIFNQISFGTDEAGSCKQILFENLSGDLKVKTSAAGFGNDFSDDKCSIKVIQDQSGAFNSVSFDGISNNFDVVHPQ